MIKRNLENKIIESLEYFPVISILGSRQVGKTTLAKKIKKIVEKNRSDAIYLDLELPSDMNIIENAELFFENNKEKMIIIDEVQRRPDLFPVLRAIVDKDRRNGRFILLGSSSPALKKETSESLAGRISQHILHPFDISETGLSGENIKKLWIRGGYPDSFLAKNDIASFKWRMAFQQTFFERDLPQLGINVSSVMIKRLWQMICHYHGQTWNASQIARSLGVSAPTVRSYMNILEETFLIRRIEPYYINIRKRLSKSPRYYIVDSGLFHLSSGIEDYNEILSFNMAGASWEGFVIEQIIRNLSFNTDYYYYRTQTGNEIDLILKKGNNITAVEIKLSMSPKVSKGLKISLDDIQADQAFIIYPGDKDYRVAENVEVVSLESFIRDHYD
ncbi:MAG: ATP-binding protein [Candidatus Muiribacteriaceae bacterium]